MTWKTQLVIKTYVQKWCDNWKTRCVDFEDKVFKIYLRHWRKNLRDYIYWVVFGGLFRTQSNIHNGVFCESSWRHLAVNYFCKRAPSWMFDWVLNRPMVLSDNHFTREMDMNWLTNKKVTKMLLWIYLISWRNNSNLLH